jgi:hypothetical protein
MKFTLTFWEKIGAVRLMHQLNISAHTQKTAWEIAKKQLNKQFPGKITLIIDKIEKR